MTKKLVKKQKGFALIITIFALAIISILGLAIIRITTSNFKMIKMDGRSQGAYYIAEAGVNYMIDKINTKVQENGSNYETSTEFFRYIEDHFTKEIDNLDSFEKNNGEQPKAFITVTQVGIDEDMRNYKIESVGKIGNSTRTVSSIITIDWIKKENNKTFDLAVDTSKFIFKGSNLNAPGKTIVISGQDNNSMNGGSKINVKNIYFKDLRNGVISGKSYGDKNNPGDIYLDGNAHILSSGRTMYGNVHTNGDFIVEGGVSIYGNLYVGGKFKIRGGSNIYGDVYVEDAFQIEGGAIIHGNVYAYKGINADGGGEIKGNLSVEGDSKMASIKVGEVVEVNGNLELGWTPTFSKNVNYTGELITPSNYNSQVLNKCKQVHDIPALNKHDYSFIIPNCTVTLKPDSWFVDNRYVIKGDEVGTIPHNAKMFVNNYKNSNWQKVTGKVIIVSKGDIILRGDKDFTGALIAPNGKVEYSGGGTFDGVIISKNEINLKGGGTTFNLKSIEEFFGGQAPVTTTCTNIDDDGGDDNSTENSVKLTVKSGIKEE